MSGTVNGDLVRGAVLEACPPAMPDEEAERIADGTLTVLAGFPEVMVLRGQPPVRWAPFRCGGCGGSPDPAMPHRLAPADVSRS